MADVRLLVPLDAIHAGDTDQVVLDAFEQWLDVLADAGAQISYCRHADADRGEPRRPCGLVIAVEAYDWHRAI